MSAVPVESTVRSDRNVAQAFYFRSGSHQLFGMLHRAHGPGSHATTASNIGLVICKPFGNENICSHRSVRAFAETAAAAGIPTLRFDYLGTGDSAAIDPEADQLEAWSHDVGAAVAELRRQTGVERIYLLGFRLGALLAMLATRSDQTVEGLILIAPVVSGRRYLKDLRTTRLAALLPTQAQSAPVDSLAGGPAKRTAALEISGFLLSAATVDALGKVDLSDARTVPRTRLLVIDGDSLPAARP